MLTLLKRGEGARV